MKEICTSVTLNKKCSKELTTFLIENPRLIGAMYNREPKKLISIHNARQAVFLYQDLNGVFRYYNFFTVEKT